MRVLKKSILFLLLGFAISLQAKNPIAKIEQLLCSKKWTIVDVDRTKNDFEIGEVFSFTVDKKFIIWRNNNTSIGGTWKVSGRNELILVFNTDSEGNNRKMPSLHKILKITRDELQLKYKYLESKDETLNREKSKTKARLTLR